ncbi:hypothetical protein PCANC_17327 [Puccinia coronata f. sp. avenae]|uniref:C2H2-type domain-containing protein n=1 Tax=Puccinia coronata f. sp. avenae TaxID=200324 RepID=A0A2N5UU85_9BASI|nr:hypothetical protein PCANC_17327 [Puccinia coronata f. sp. avenae]
MESQSYDIPQFLLDLGIEGTDVPKSQSLNGPSENATPIFTFETDPCEPTVTDPCEPTVTDPSHMYGSLDFSWGNIPRPHPGGFFPPPMHQTEGNLPVSWAPRDAYASNVDFHGCDRFCEPGSSSHPAQATGAHVPETILKNDFIYANPEGGILPMPVALEQSTSIFGANTFDPHGCDRFCEPGSSSYLAQATGVRAPVAIQAPEFYFTIPGGGSSSMPMALERSTSVFGTDTCGPTSYHFNVANERLGCTPVHLPTQLDVVEENTLRSQPGFNPPSIDPAELNLSAPEAPSATSAPSGSSEPPASQHDNSNQGLFKCPHCGHVFDRKYNLNEHIKYIHGNPKKFCCRYDPQCKSTFTREHDYKQHLQRKHNQKRITQERATVPEKATERFPCPYAKCKSTYANLNSNHYRKHVKRFHKLTITRNYLASSRQSAN